MALALAAGVMAVWQLAGPAAQPAGPLAAADGGPLEAEAATRPDSNDLVYVTDSSGVVVMNGRTLDSHPVGVLAIPPDASFTNLVVSAVSDDGRLLLAGTQAGSGVAVFDLTTTSYRRWFPVGPLRRISRARLSPDGTTLAAIEQDGRVHVLDARTGASRHVVSVPGQNFDGRFDRTGRLLFVPNRDAGSVSVIDVADVHEIGRITTADGAHNIVMTPDGGRGFVNNAYDGSVSCVDLVERQVIEKVAVGEEPFEIAIGLDGLTVYVGNRGDGSLVVFDAEACQVREVVHDALGGARPGPIAVSNDGSRVFVAALDEPFIEVFDAACTGLRSVGRIPLRAKASSILPGPLAPLAPTATGSIATTGGDCDPAVPPAAAARLPGTAR